MMRVSRMVAAAAAAAAISVGALGAGPAQARPVTDPVSTLVAAGVPAPIAGAAVTAPPVAAGVDEVRLAGPIAAAPRLRVDAQIDHNRRTIKVIQRDLIDRSQLTAAWVNLRTGASGVAGLPRSERTGVPQSYPDRFGILPTGSGPVTLVVYGLTPSQTALPPLRSFVLVVRTFQV